MVDFANDQDQRVRQNNQTHGCSYIPSFQCSLLYITLKTFDFGFSMHANYFIGSTTLVLMKGIREGTG